MTKEPFIAHSELTNEIYIVQGRNKYRVTEQAIHAVKAIKALEQEPMVEIDLYSVIKQSYIERDVLDKIRAEIEEPLKINQGLNTESAKAQAIALSWVLEVIDKYKG
jgi:pyruvate dehydrogenase complex dehydrogenase (E1) component